MDAILSYKPEKAEKALFFLHGYGADGGDLYQMLPDLKEALPKTAFYFPTAPEQAPWQGNQWFELSDYNPAQFSLEYLDILIERALKNINIINNLIEYIKQENNILASQISLAGFSQGGLMAVLTALLREDMVERAISLSGLPLYFGQSLKPEQVISFPPLLFIQGQGDDVVPPASLRLTADSLKKAKISASFEEIPAMGHEINSKAFFRMIDFLKKGAEEK